ncbi:MAG: nicotinate phosphoribosyltransferase [Gammaproteobacteria bacterium]|nr:nicotinate phosphoribosyltransferase [Gammaproteobacteria bacterium]
MIDTHANSALLTDLYELTMLNAYHDQGMNHTAVFEFFVRKLPPERNFLLAAGLEQALTYLEGLCFTPEEVQWLAGTGKFSRSFVEALEHFRFSGDVHAMPEGTVFFPNEPILRVTAPLPQAQVIESRIINILHAQVLFASKAARCVLAGPGKQLVDFGMRRAHGAEAALFAARASYLAGLTGTATVLAGKLYDIPIFGTMAHSFIEAHDTEVEAFHNFAKSQPGNVVLLIDTYDTEQGARRVVELAPRLRDEGITVKAVRLDSGDHSENSRRVRAILDAGGCKHIGIFASGNLDEYKMEDLLRDAAPIDGFGIGTNLDVSADVPFLDSAYKLVEYAERPRRKRSPEKATWPGRKQVYRVYERGGAMSHDVLTLEEDDSQGEPLLQPVMRAGRRIAPSPALSALRERAAAELERLPSSLRELGRHVSYRVTVSQRLRDLAAQVDREFT